MTIAARGFTLIELMITVAIVALLASIAVPLTETVAQRGREKELRAGLRQMREAIDAYKRASDDGIIERPADKSGYPPSLEALVEGAKDKRKPDAPKVYFLRRIPRDPIGGERWGVRSYASSADDPREGEDVYDVFSLAQGAGMNGTAYREW